MWFEGHVSDLAAFYDDIRVIVSPIRFGSGVKLKTLQAIQYAVPTVATSIGAEGLDVPAAGLHVLDDPSLFADAVIRLLTDEREWRHSRDALVTCVDAWDTARVGDAWPRLLNELCKEGQWERHSTRATPSCQI